ncbi:hypothetical protein NOR_06182 [Metarhizium rileyi]|uniref:Uncharacterized protein n=1 Tax=Metarhizium rileyi (strain RCEF 4871) TaxID=1649241 RepID=A0A167AUM3_METRR|nr:hypothetical protein NOR_06182 [Metarhizium rileyi RCEF 4871]
MTLQATPEQLHEAMTGLETTDHWDVLVSYSEDQLNQILKRTWGGLHKVAKPTFNVSNRLGQRTFTDVYDLVLEDPMIQFKQIDASPWATLTLSVSGTQRPKDSNDPGDVLFIPKGLYKFQVNVPLSSVSGKGTDHPVAADGKTIHFDDRTEASYHVTFHFKNEATVWQVVRNDSQEAVNYVEQALNGSVDALKRYFQALTNLDCITLSLAEISNKRAAKTQPQHPSQSKQNEHISSFQDLLCPVSFSLASQPGVLNVFIATKGGGRGEGSKTRQFGIKPGVHYTPVPTGYGASIVISRHIIVKKFLIPAITRASKDLRRVAVTERPTNKSGVTLQVVYPPQYLFEWVMNKVKDPLGNDTIALAKPDTLETDAKPLLLEIADNPKTLVPEYGWSWSGTGSIGYDVWFIITRLPRTSTFDLSIKTKEPRSFLSIQNDRIAATMTFDAEGTEKRTGKDGDDTLKVGLLFPSFELRLDELDYFRTTNVFFPGRHMIDSKRAMFPGDLVILGDITKT